MVHVCSILDKFNSASIMTNSQGFEMSVSSPDCCCTYSIKLIDEWIKWNQTESATARVLHFLSTTQRHVSVGKIDSSGCLILLARYQIPHRRGLLSGEPTRAHTSPVINSLPRLVYWTMESNLCSRHLIKGRRPHFFSRQAQNRPSRPSRRPLGSSLPRRQIAKYWSSRQITACGAVFPCPVWRTEPLRPL